MSNTVHLALRPEHNNTRQAVSSLKALWEQLGSPDPSDGQWATLRDLYHDDWRRCDNWLADRGLTLWRVTDRSGRDRGTVRAADAAGAITLALINQDDPHELTRRDLVAVAA